MSVDKPSLTLLVLTYNEEVNLEYCLRSAANVAQKIFVVDSGSTDGTVEIAERCGAEVVQHPFVNQAVQLNWALDNLPIETEWVLRLDADEYLSAALRKELVEVLPKLPSNITGLYIKWRLVFLGRWIRHGGLYPNALLRLFRQGKGRSEQIEMDERMILSAGESRHLEHDFIHYNRKPFSDWTLKHDRYASREARVMREHETGNQEGERIRANAFGKHEERKRWGKVNFYARLPLFARAFLFFFYRYVVRLGFRDGVEGLIFHFLQTCWYRFYVDAKIWEARLAEKSPRADSTLR